MKVLPKVVIDKIQICSLPTIRKMLQEFIGLLGYWRAFIPHLAQILKSLYALIRRGQQWDWWEKNQWAFEEAKQGIK